MTYDIIARSGHYEVHINGKFYCSTDTIGEAVEEVMNYYEAEN